MLSVCLQLEAAIVSASLYSAPLLSLLFQPVASADDHAPAASTALWLGLFYLCMPTGVALGYLFGGAIGSGE